MRNIESSTSLTENEIFNLKNKIENIKNPKNINIINNLILNLENDLIKDNNNIYFDLKTLKPITLLILRSFLKKLK